MKDGARGGDSEVEVEGEAVWLGESGGEASWEEERENRTVGREGVGWEAKYVISKEWCHGEKKPKGGRFGRGRGWKGERMGGEGAGW